MTAPTRDELARLARDAHGPGARVLISRASPLVGGWVAEVSVTVARELHYLRAPTCPEARRRLRDELRGVISRRTGRAA